MGDVDETGVLFQLSRKPWSGPKGWTARDSNGGYRCLDPVVGGQVLDGSD